MKLVIAILSAAVLLAPAFASGGKEVSRAAAQKTALDLVQGGVVRGAERENEEGNEIWSFDISTGTVTREIWIDAFTGLIIQDKTETRAAEKKEQVEEKAARKVKPISRAAAQKAALELVKGGVIKEGELEREKGLYIWSFDIKDGAKTREVWIDAVTGKPVLNNEESQGEEKAEAAAEGKK